VTNENWQKSVGSWSFQHVNDILKTRPISRGDGVPVTLPEKLDVDRIKSLEVTDVKRADNPTPPTPPVTVKDIIAATNTDGWLVLHNDVVVVEEYFGEMQENTKHLLMSVTKSLTATVAGALVHNEKRGRDEPLVDDSKRVADYETELDRPPRVYADAYVREVLDMRSGVEFSEAYLDPESEVRQMEAAAGWAPLPPRDSTDPPPAATLKDFLRGLKQDRGRSGHGGPFKYRSCETGMLGWVCEAAYQKRYNLTKRFPVLVSELLWSKLGAEEPAYITVDREGTGAFDGGICATLRDLARFGAMICRNGLSLSDQQVVSEEWVNDIFKEGGRNDYPQDQYPGMYGGKYRSMFWSPTDDRNVVLCTGVYGQMVYINKYTKTVGVKLSSWEHPEIKWPGDPWMGCSAFKMFDAISTDLDRPAPTT
jgi:hypothetical protein